MMKFFSLFLLALSLFLNFSTKVSAQEAWKINEFQAKIDIEKSGVVRIIESLNVDFGSEKKHGIFRNIPFIYQDLNQQKHYLEIDVLDVKRNDAREIFEADKVTKDIVIKIGDPERTITGTQVYTIEYQVIGALLGYNDFDELYWDVLGGEWAVMVEKVKVEVKLPSEGLHQTSCYQGYSGSKEECLITESSKTEVVFDSTRSFNPGEGFTIAVGYTKGLVPLLIGSAPKNVFDDFGKIPNLIISFVVLTVGLFLIWSLWFKKGRDRWFGRNYLLGTRSSNVPIDSEETIVVEYSPPDNLRPAELAALLDEKAETLDVTATLVDLANRGYLNITEEPKKWLFGNTDYIFEKQEKDSANLLEYEQELLLRLFDENSTVSLSSLKNKFYKDLAVVKEKLYLNLADKKFFAENPSKVRSKYSLIAIFIGVVGGLVIWLGFSMVKGLLVEVGVVVLILAVVFLVIAQFMPKRTAEGRQLFARAKGYRLFIETAEKYRQQFFEKKNLFNEVLPYAIAFGLTKKFAQAFEKMGLKPEQPSWYHSSTAFQAVTFGEALNSFSTTVSNSIASSPSSSGSGGGGSAGGGFGGGGGGSW